MSLPKSYEEISATLGIPIPWGWDPQGSRRVTRSGVRLFLMRAYVIPTFADPPWLRLWKQIEWTREQCKVLHIVIPSALWDEDKARLAAKISATHDTSYPEEKERALRWARR
jgi:hypothetical protein